MGAKFDAAGYLKAAGMNLIGAGDKDGLLRVRNSDGQEGTLDVNAILAAEGIKGADITVNDPTTALEKSPASLADRAAVSFGNAKGSLSYLKKNFQDARLGEDGEMVVKDKGVWHKFDAQGLGDGSGWDMATEFAKDILDWTGEAPLIGGQIGGATIGATLGGAGGAVAGSVVPVAGTAAGLTAGVAAGTVAGSAVGGGIGSGIKMAMGRIIGTFDATSQEVARDLAIDTLMSASGEVVALGAKHAILPGLKNMINFFGTKAAPHAQNIAATTIAQTTGAPIDDALFLVKNSTEVSPAINETIKRAYSRAQEEGTTLTTDFVQREARATTMNYVNLIAKDAQKNASNKFTAGFRDVVAEVPDTLDDGGNFQNTIFETFQKLSDNGFVKVADKGAKKGRFIPADASFMEKQMGMVDGQAVKSFQSHISKLANTLEMLSAKAPGDAQKVASMSSSKRLKGKELAEQIFESIRSLRELQRNIPETHKQTRVLIGDIATGFSKQARQGLPEGVLSKASAVDAAYARNIQYVDRAEQALRTGDTGIESLINERRAGGNSVQNMFDALADLHPGGKGLKRELSKSLAVETFYNIVPRGSIGSSALRTGAVAGGFAVGGAMGAAAAGVAMSPRMIAKSMNGAAMVNKTMKNLSQKARLDLLADQKSMEAVFGELFRNLPNKE